MEAQKIDKDKLITQAEYARNKGVSRQRINQMVKSNLLKTISIKGAILIMLD